MKLSTLAILLGLLVVVKNIYGLIKPAAFGAAARKFPRYTPVGYPLMLLATAWFVWNVYREPIADFAVMKPYLCGFFAAIGLGACIFVKDFLPVRGLAVLLLLLAKLMVDTARWVDTEWRLVIVTWAYIWIFVGMWFTISPWRLRDLVNWATVSEKRIRLFSGLRVAFGALVLLLGFTAYPAAEKREPKQQSPEPVQLSETAAPYARPAAE